MCHKTNFWKFGFFEKKKKKSEKTHLKIVICVYSLPVHSPGDMWSTWRRRQRHQRYPVLLPSAGRSSAYGTGWRWWSLRRQCHCHLLGRQWTAGRRWYPHLGGAPLHLHRNCCQTSAMWDGGWWLGAIGGNRNNGMWETQWEAIDAIGGDRRNGRW